MPKCKNEVFLSKIGEKKLTNQVEVDIEIADDLTDCKKINVSKYVSTSATSPSYSQFSVPANQFECMQNGCVNSGTLYNGGAETVYRTKESAVDFASGVITFYVTGAPSGANAVVKLSSDSTFTNADSYSVALNNIKEGSDGYKAVVIDLSQAGTAVGEGWTPSEGGAYISIAVTGSGTLTGVGISSIAIFDEMEDFAISNVIKMACMTGIDHTWELDVAEASCFESGYNTTDLSGFDITLTGRAITANFMTLNPFAKKGSATSSFDMAQIQATVTAEGNYGQVVIDDIDQSECRFISVQRADICVGHDAQLHRLSIPQSVVLGEDQYLLVDNGDGTTTILFNSAHVGKDMLISYPRTVSVEEWIFSDDRLESIHGALSYTKCYSDGIKYRYVYDNVLVTSISNSLSTDDEPEISVGLRILRNTQGRYGRAYKIIG